MDSSASVVLKATFRGRTLRGTRQPVPACYRGLIFRELPEAVMTQNSRMPSETERIVCFYSFTTARVRLDAHPTSPAHILQRNQKNSMSRKMRRILMTILMKKLQRQGGARRQRGWLSGGGSIRYSRRPRSGPPPPLLRTSPTGIARTLRPLMYMILLFCYMPFLLFMLNCPRIKFNAGCLTSISPLLSMLLLATLCAHTQSPLFLSSPLPHFTSN